jgi:hypothetical protein
MHLPITLIFAIMLGRLLKEVLKLDLKKELEHYLSDFLSLQHCIVPITLRKQSVLPI